MLCKHKYEEGSVKLLPFPLAQINPLIFGLLVKVWSSLAFPFLFVAIKNRKGKKICASNFSPTVKIQILIFLFGHYADL